MGQKVNPNGLRLGINKDWDAKWYSNNKDFAKTLSADLKIRDYIAKNMKNAGIAKVEIERTKDITEIVIHTSKPGVIIGSGGEEVENTRKALANLTGNRASFRMAQKRAIRNAMKAGAKGIKTKVSGRLGGADMARGEGYSDGTIPLHTLRADVDYGTAEADTTFGKIGVKVWIYKGEILNKKAKGGN